MKRAADKELRQKAVEGEDRAFVDTSALTDWLLPQLLTECERASLMILLLLCLPWWLLVRAGLCLLCFGGAFGGA